MERLITGKQIKKCLCLFLCTCFLVVITQVTMAQKPVKICTIRDGRMYIELSRSISQPALDSFIRQFNLEELSLKELVVKNITDSIKKQGWSIDKNNKERVAISKALLSSDNIDKPGEELILSIANQFQGARSGVIMGYNKLRKGNGFAIDDSIVRFVLRNYTNAKRVILAGSFNNFSTEALPMQKTDTGWVAYISLRPGKYWYKFVIDGDWRIDDDNMLKENDGKGNINSVFYKTNTNFRLSGFTNAKKVYLAGSFNNWQPRDLLMQRTEAGWALPLYLAEGTYTYRFIADGSWFVDPANPEKVPNEFNDYNSVTRIGKPYLFRLNGFQQAQRVTVFGSFNNWQRNELFMKKTGYGWELPYTLGLGNYEYRFKVDEAEITDPANPFFTGNDRQKGNSVLILGANYTFHLKGFEDAKTIILAGDFNNFNETAYVMHKKDGVWEYTVYLSPGKHLYKFIVDGKWIIDPANKLWEQNEYGTGNSVIWLEVDQ